MNIEDVTPENVTDKIISEFISIAKKSDVISITYNPDLIKKTEERTNLTGVAEKLEQIAKTTDNDSIAHLAAEVKNKAQEMALRNSDLRGEYKKASDEANILRKSEEALIRQVSFLKGSSNQNVENLINGMHSVATLSQAIVAASEQVIKSLSKLDIDKKQKEKLANIMTTAIRINKLATLAYKGDQNLKKGEHDIRGFIEGYIKVGLARKGEIDYEIVPAEGAPVMCTFDTSAVEVIFDNLINNSIKAGANKMMITFEDMKDIVIVHFRDNGFGLSKFADPEQIFNCGYSTNTHGTGIGLYHVKKLALGMRGNVYYNPDIDDGFELILELKNES